MKKMLVALGLLAAIAVAAWAQTSGTNTVSQGGYFRNATTQQRTDADGAQYVTDIARDRDSYLAPVSIFTGQIAAGAADTTDIVDLSAYRSVALLIQVSGTANSSWLTFAFHARYNLAGLSDSLSLFTIPVAVSDSIAAAGALPSSQGGAFVVRGTLPGAAALADGEFPVTITTTNGTSGAASQSLPQGRIVWLRAPQGNFAWPSRCSFRIRNILRSTAIGAAGPTVRVWIMGTPL